jgi:hypothetical protein
MAIRPAYPDAGTLSRKWKEGVQNAGEHWVDGIQNPRADFKAEAIKANPAYKAGVQKAIAEDAWVKGMQNTDPNEAIATAVAVGASGYVAGALARGAKHERVMARVVPLMTAAVNTVRSMPAVTDADRENRAVAMIREGRKVGQKLAGR